MHLRINLETTSYMNTQIPSGTMKYITQLKSSSQIIEHMHILRDAFYD